jgi:phosphoenolpyruvate carboxykinase (GTP)
LDLTGLDISPEDMRELLRIDAGLWCKEMGSIREYFKLFGDHLPLALSKQLEAFIAALQT